MNTITKWVVVSLMLTVSSAQAQTWNGGGGDDFWTTSGNWNTLPSSGSSLIFAGSTRTINTNDFAAGTLFNRIRFNSNAAAFTLTGNAVTLGPDGIDFNANPGSPITQTIALDLILNGNRTVATRGNGTIEITGNISDDGGSRSLTKTNAGTLILSGTNTFGGPLVISTATVQFSDIAAIASIGGIQLGAESNNGILLYVGTNDITVGQTVWLHDNAAGNGNATLNVDGTGTMTFTNANFNTPQGSATETNRNFLVRGTGNGVIQGVIRDNNASSVIRVTKNDTGTWTLLGDNLYSGDTRIAQGTLVAGHNNAFGTTGTVIIDGSTTGSRLDLMNGVTLSNRLEFGNDDPSRVKTVGLAAGATSATYAGEIGLADIRSRNTVFHADDGQTLHVTGQIVNGGPDGHWGIEKAGAGLLILSGANTYTNRTRLQGGTLRAAHNSALGTSALAITGNTTFELADGLTVANEMETFSPGATSTKVIRLMEGATSAELTGNLSLNAEVGGITLQAGKGGTLTFSGAISASIGSNDNIAKTGAGTVVLAGTNTYGGTTTVEAGTLRVSSSGSVAGSAVAVEDGARFIVDGAYTAGLITVADGATAGGSGTVGDVNFEEGARLLFQPGVALEVADTFTISFGGFGVANLVDINGSDYTVWRSLVDIGQTYTLIDGDGIVNNANINNLGYANRFDIGDGKEAYFTNESLKLVVIPEPGSGFLLAFAAGGRRDLGLQRLHSNHQYERLHRGHAV